MPLGHESLVVAIAGATSLRGKDLSQWLEESGFPAGDIRLIDEEFAAGTLTEAGGEPAIVQAVDESSFERVRFAFFAGSPAFAAKHGPSAGRAGATVIDLTGGLWTGSRALPWIPALDAVLPPPGAPGASSERNHVWVAPSAPAIVACSFSAALSELSPARLAIVFLQPASERGQAGVTELEQQTIRLLSLQPIPQEVFDTQVAFNLLGRWGESSAERLSEARIAITREVHQYLEGGAVIPALTLVQAPVFHAHGFSAYAEFREPPAPEALAARLGAVGFRIASGEDLGPSNLAVAAEAKPLISLAERDDNVACGYWFWGAADNFRVASANAVRIAERFLAS